MAVLLLKLGLLSYTDWVATCCRLAAYNAKRPCRSKARNADPAAMAAWQAAVHGLRAAVNSWLAKASKHAMVAYPLLTQLLCLETDDGFQQGIGPLLDTLQKQLRVRLLSQRGPTSIYGAQQQPHWVSARGPRRAI